MHAIRSFFLELHRRDPLLSSLGWTFIGLLTIFAVVAPFESRTILGINPWIKPAKFAISLAIFLWTVGWLVAPLSCYVWVKRIIRWGIGLAMTLEMILITVQSARGVRSHFNTESAFDSIVFSSMGLLIGLSSTLTLGLFVMYLMERDSRPKHYLWAVRLGLIIFLIASAEGGVMIVRGGHAVGVADGGQGLPFVNWSTLAGDLRIAHFLGLHALQLLPLFAWGLKLRAPHLTQKRLITCVFVVGLIYAGVVVGLFLFSMTGRPLIGG